MRAFSISFGATRPISYGSSAPARMCRTVMLLTLVMMNIHASSQIPPRISTCRNVHKAKADHNEDYIFTQRESCGYTVSFPIPEGRTINLTDHRNCENFYRCSSYSCQQCPCEPGQTFNPQTLRCDTTNAPCVCPAAATTPVPTTAAVPTTAPAIIETTKRPLVVKDAGTEKQNNGDPNNAVKPVSTEVIVIAAIVSATVIVIVVIVMAVFCWQRRQNQQNVRMSKPKPVPEKLSSSTPDGYSTSIPPSEKHVYAEIDERMINGRKHWQHGGSMRAPPLPNHQPPPTSPPLGHTCPEHPHHHHPRHNRCDSGVGSADTSFTTNCPRRTFQPINPAYNIKLGVPYNEQSPAGNPHCCGDEMYHGTEDSSASSDSQYSHSSNPTSLDSHDIDMRTPLHANSAKLNYVSKQVYI